LAASFLGFVLVCICPVCGSNGLPQVVSVSCISNSWQHQTVDESLESPLTTTEQQLLQLQQYLISFDCVSPLLFLNPVCCINNNNEQGYLGQQNGSHATFISKRMMRALDSFFFLFFFAPTIKMQLVFINTLWKAWHRMASAWSWLSIYR
jgi:hypothetical protein